MGRVIALVVSVVFIAFGRGEASENWATASPVDPDQMTGTRDNGIINLFLEEVWVDDHDQEKTR
jgi:hypothetical protein